jgi:protein-disulfide isomerase
MIVWRCGGIAGPFAMLLSARAQLKGISGIASALRTFQVVKRHHLLATWHVTRFSAPAGALMKVLDLALVVTSISAVVLTGTAANSALHHPPKPLLVATRVSDWQSYSAGGHRSGPAEARVTILEFADFECPYCANIAPTLSALREKYPQDVALIFRHFPLQRIHANALRAAIAAECAAAEDRFDSVAVALFAFQDSLGIRPWNWFARRGGVMDTVAFIRCLREEASDSAVNVDIAAGERLGVTVSPTIVVNGWRFSAPPSGAALDSIVRVILGRR